MRIHAIASVCVAVATPAHADVQLWTELGVKRELTPRITLSLDQHLRFDDDVSRVASIMPELGVHYHFTRWLRASAGYRLEYERDKAGDMVVRHRAFTNVRTRLKLGPFRVEHRLQLQDSIRPDSMDVHRPTIRLRFGVAYRRMRPWVPAVAFETFHRMDDVHVNKVWLTAGGSRTGPREVEAFFRLELSPDEPTISIVGLAFHVEP